MTITTDRGHTYNLSDKAVLELKAARTADKAERAFSQYADHVPKSDRCDVWNQL